MSAFQKIEARILAGDELTVADVETEIAADPVAAAAFKTLAVANRTGLVEITLADVERRTGFPVQFMRAVELARVHGACVIGAHLIHPGEAVH